MSEKEKEELLSRLGAKEEQLPKIFSNDPAIRHLNAKKGDIIKITRKSPTAGRSVYYRVVIE